MSLVIPPNNQWNQPNNSDRTGSIWYSKNINLDEQGYLKLSPRSIKVMDQAQTTNFGVPVAIGRSGAGSFEIGTASNANFSTTISETERTFTEDTGSGNPLMTSDSHSTYFNDTWLCSTDTAILSKSFGGAGTGAWTSRITGLTSGKRHYMEVFRNRDSICVSNGNVVKQYNNSYSNTTDLTIPSDFEIVGLCYNNSKMAVITRPASSDTNNNAYMFVWNGANASAESGYDSGATAIISCVPYKGSFAILTIKGELLLFSGGGFTKLAQFPFFVSPRSLGEPTTDISFGDSMYPEGDKIIINASFIFLSYGEKDSRNLEKNPSGVWCYEPKVGLYHRYSPSISTGDVFTVTDTNLNLSTDLFTVSSGTVPATGNPCIYSQSTNPITGIKTGKLYYIIKKSSTTFKLATSKSNAISGVVIDITAKGSGGNNYFWIYTIKDYGATFHNLRSGAVRPIGDTTNIYEGHIFGGDYYDTSLANNDSICMTVPKLENRGYAILPKIFSSEIVDSARDLFIRFKPLITEEDKIIVKYRNKDVNGLPVSTPTSSTEQGEWMANNIVKTSQDMSEAETHLNNGGSLELEVISGAGAGSLVNVESIGSDAGVYSFVLSEDVVGVSAGLLCHFSVDNWEEIGSITSDDEEGYKAFPIGGDSGSASKFHQFKVEIRGWNITIEDIKLSTKTNKASA